MKNDKKMCHKRLKLIIFFFLGWFMPMVCMSVFVIPYNKLCLSRCMGAQKIIYEALQKHINTGGETPLNIGELKRLEYISPSGYQQFTIEADISTLERRHDFNFYPDAWNRPGQILLQTSVLGTYVLTFGDGTRAILSELIPTQNSSVENANEYRKIELHIIGRNRYSLFGLFFIVIPAFVFAVVVILVLVLKIKEKKLEGDTE